MRLFDFEDGGLLLALNEKAGDKKDQSYEKKYKPLGVVPDKTGIERPEPFQVYLFERMDEHDERRRCPEAHEPRYLVARNSLRREPRPDLLHAPDGIGIGKNLGDIEAVTQEVTVMELCQRPLFLPDGRAVGPIKKKGVNQEKIDVAAQEAETRIYQVIRHIVGVPDHSVCACPAQHHVANENAFGHIMKKTAEDQKDAGEDKPHPVKFVEDGGYQADNNDNVAQIAAVNQRAPALEVTVARYIYVRRQSLSGRFVIYHNYWSCIAFSVSEWYLLLSLPISRAQKYYKK